jgi:hypothetical protein
MKSMAASVLVSWIPCSGGASPYNSLVKAQEKESWVLLPTTSVFSSHVRELL